MTGAEIVDRAFENCEHVQSTCKLGTCEPCLLAAIDAALREERERIIKILDEWSLIDFLRDKKYAELVSEIRQPESMP